MSKVIEIVVIGGTGTGKSHVLELIDKALRAEYGHHVQIASHDLSCERGLGSPGEKPRVSDTIFSLREQGLDSAKTVGSLKIEIDTSSATGQVEALQSFTTGYAVDPIESAIELVVRLLGDERDRLREAHAKSGEGGFLVDCLGSHLERLLVFQLKRLAE